MLGKHRKETLFQLRSAGAGDKVAFLPLMGGEDFYRWKERADVTVRKEAEGARLSEK